MSRKILFLARGGSHAYGLETPKSDIDLRGIFIDNSVEHLVGLKKDEVIVEQDAEKDNVMVEFRHMLRQLKNANTQMIELLFQKESLELDPIWHEVVSNKSRLISSDKLFSCLKGYMQGELRLAYGERTGKLGGKRKEAIDKYGFSPKNFVQLFRLAWAGQAYMYKGYFPVKVSEEDVVFSTFLRRIKTQPEQFSKEELNLLAKEHEEMLKSAYDNRKVHTEFDEQIANDLCLRVYAPLINKYYAERTQIG